MLLAHRGDLLLLGVGMTRATIVHLAERRAGRQGFVRWALTTQLTPPRQQAEILLAPTRRLTADVAHSTAQRKVAHQLLFAPPDRQSSSIREIPGFPGCSDGFDQLEPYLADVARSVQIGQAPARRYPLGAVMLKATALLREDPEALLCADPGCERCKAVRRGAQPQAGPASKPVTFRN